jgi:hypothetical protein
VNRDNISVLYEFMRVRSSGDAQLQILRKIANFIKHMRLLAKMVFFIVSTVQVCVVFREAIFLTIMQYYCMLLLKSNFCFWKWVLRQLGRSSKMGFSLIGSLHAPDCVVFREPCGETSSDQIKLLLLKVGFVR